MFAGIRSRCSKRSFMRKSLIIGGWILLALLSAATFMLLNWEQPNANAASNEGAPLAPNVPAISADAPAIETRARVVPAQTVDLSFPNKGIGDGVMEIGRASCRERV